MKLSTSEDSPARIRTCIEKLGPNFPYRLTEKDEIKYLSRNYYSTYKHIAEKTEKESEPRNLNKNSRTFKFIQYDNPRY